MQLKEQMNLNVYEKNMRAVQFYQHRRFKGVNQKIDGNPSEEGCLSLTGVRKTTRYENIEVEYYDMNWKKQRQKLSGWPAQICQHELDHLEGILI